MADQFLSQEEVDALLDGVSGGAAAETPDEEDGVRGYDLGKQERIVRGRMPTLEIVNERFARNLRLGLFNFIRRNPEISVGQSKVQKYSAFLRNIVVPTNINIMNVRPLRGSALVICEPSLVFTAIDTLFGGSGKMHTRIEGRDFSATEQRIILRIVEVITEEYRKAWEGIYPIEFEYVRSEMHTQFANIGTPSEIMVTVSFDVEIGEAGGALHICIPYSTLEPIREMLYSSVRGDQQQADRRWVNLLTQQLKSADVGLVAEFATAHTTVRDLVALKKGDFIALDAPDSVTVKVDRVPIFDCHYGVSRGRYAVKVREILSKPEDVLKGMSDE